MSILTLTTDFGVNNYYLATFKGLILNRVQPIQFIDISHDTKVFDIQSAAYQVRNCWYNFPKNTVHFIHVGEQYANKNRFIACRYDQQFFLLPDNGLITLILNTQPDEVVPINTGKNGMYFELLANTIKDIFQTNSLSNLGHTTQQYMERILPQPISNQNLIRGSVEYINRYGNLITNISKPLFDQVHQQRDYEVMTRSVQFKTISPSYYSVGEGDEVCFFNPGQMLELAINSGNASGLFGLRVGDHVQIEFY